MKIFINDIPVSIISYDELDTNRDFDLEIDGSTGKINPKSLIDDVLVKNAAAQKVDELLHIMTDKKLKQLDSVTFCSEDKKSIIKYIKKKFKVIEAAGGVVDKGGKILLIYRKGFWDIPKGKMDKGEKKKDCAIREVEEETGVKVSIEKKIISTWHTYINKEKYVLKKTHWYMMNCEDDTKLGPQQEEGIQEVRWMNLSELRAALYNSYRSIRVVIQEYHKLLKINQDNS